MLLEARNLQFSYSNRPVLRDIALALAPGELRTIIGPNGSGKSTLLRVLLGQLKTTGSVAWDGREVRKWRARDLAKFVAYLPQSPAWEPGQSVAETLRLGRGPYLGAFGVESRRDADVVTKVADRLALTDLLDRPLDTLSGGQRQRVFVGRCLVQEPRALLLDEPNTFLDVRYQIELWRLLKNIAAQQQIGVLMASHDLNLAGTFADSMLLLSDGKTAAIGTPRDVLKEEVLSGVFGTPMDVFRHSDGSNRAPLVTPRLHE